MDDDENDPLIALRAKIHVLEIETAGLRQALAVVAASLCQENLEAARRTISLLTSAAICARVQDDTPTNLAIDDVIRMLLPLVSEGLNPELLLALRAQMLIDAGPQRRAALDEWLAHASPDELGEDFRELVQRALRRSPPGRTEGAKGASE